ncbi:MAG: hypothetical protein R2766_06985 [Saprospiraceae bacterium]
MHRVTYDQITGEIIILPIHFAEILGDATEGGWSTGQQLDGSVTSTGGSWSKGCCHQSWSVENKI